MNKVQSQVYTLGLLVLITQGVIGYFLFSENSFFDVAKIVILFLTIWIAIGVTLKEKLTLIFSYVSFFSFIIFLVSIYFTHEVWFRYAPFTPFSSLGHHDSFFHISIINSILNDFYPSIAQDDLVPIGYHVLSHYIDAIIYRFIGLTPFDSFSLLYFIKTSFVISCFLLFVVYNSKNKYDYCLKVLVFLPLFVEVGHFTGSFGLSWVLPILFVAVHIVFKIIDSENNISNIEYLIISTFVVLLTLGKVSSGVGFLAIIGIPLLLKEYKNKGFYIFSFFMLIFFVFQVLIFSNAGGKVVGFPNLYDFFVYPMKYMDISDGIHIIYISILLYVAMFFLTKIVYSL